MDLVLPPYGVSGVDGREWGPSAPQAKFHAQRNQRFVYMRGGAGSGKSHAGSREFLARIFEGLEATSSGARIARPLLYVAAAPTRGLCEAGPWTHITSWLDEFQIRNGFSLVKKMSLTWPRKVVLVGGATILFSHLASAQQFAGWTIAGVWLDEAELADSPLDSFIAANNRMRETRVTPWAIVTSTPRAGASLATHFKDRMSQGDSDYAMMVAPSDSNPTLAPSYIASMAATMSEREAAMMLRGEMVEATGTIYGLEFSGSESMAWSWQWHGAPRADRKYYIAIDNPPNAHALIVEHDPSGGTYIVFDEVIMDGAQPDAFFQAIVDRCKQKWGIRRDHVDGVYIDAMPPMCRRLAYSRRFWARKVHYRIVRGDRKDKESGIATVRWALLSSDGARRTLFAPRLRETPQRRGIIACMAQYAEITSVRDGQLVRTGRTDNKSPWGHGPDALRYLLWIRESHLRWHDTERVAA